MPPKSRIEDDVGDEEGVEPPAEHARVSGDDDVACLEMRCLPLHVKEAILARASGEWTSTEISAMVACEPLMKRALAPAAIVAELEKDTLGSFWRTTLLQCYDEGSDDRRLEEAFAQAKFCRELKAWSTSTLEHACSTFEGASISPSVRLLGEVRRAQKLQNAACWWESISSREAVMSFVVFVKVKDEEGSARVGCVHFRYAVNFLKLTSDEDIYPLGSRSLRISVRKWDAGGASDVGERDEWIPFPANQLQANWSPLYRLGYLLPHILAHTLPELHDRGCVHVGAPPAALRALVAHRADAQRVSVDLIRAYFSQRTETTGAPDDGSLVTVNADFRNEDLLYDRRTTLDELKLEYSDKTKIPAYLIEFVLDGHVLLPGDTLVTLSKSITVTSKLSPYQKLKW